MLDRESQNESTIVQWSTDGNSFIIKDQTQFEAVSSIYDDVTPSKLQIFNRIELTHHACFNN